MLCTRVVNKIYVTPYCEKYECELKDDDQSQDTNVLAINKVHSTLRVGHK